MTACHPAALDQHSMLLESIEIGWQMATPTLQQGAELTECQYSSTDKKIMYLHTHTHTHTHTQTHTHTHYTQTTCTCIDLFRDWKAFQFREGDVSSWWLTDSSLLLLTLHRTYHVQVDYW